MEINDTMTTLEKIPFLPVITSWEDIEIKECGEKLISLNELSLNMMVMEPQYYIQGIANSMKECFVRETVADMLTEASNLLPTNYKFVIWDAWRPIEVQEAIFSRYKKKLQDESRAFSEEKLIGLVKKYVSLPSLDEKSPPLHSTGGAVDLSIVDGSGKYLDMGTLYDDFSIKAGTRYFEEKIERGESLFDNEEIVLDNRRLLFHTLTAVGFTNHPEEWWHYDYGNQFWAGIKGRIAIYGRMEINRNL